MRFLSRLHLTVSQAVNAFVFAGEPDESLCARAWRQRFDGWGDRMDWLDSLFGAGHCKKVHEDHIARHKARNPRPSRRG